MITGITLILILILAGFASLALFIRHRTVKLADQLDGRLTELLKVTKALARAEGVTEGQARERAAHGEPQKAPRAEPRSRP